MPEEIPPTLFRSPKRSQNSTEINPALTSQNPTLSKTSKAPTQLPTRKRYKMRLFFCWGIFARAGAALFREIAKPQNYAICW